VARLDREGLAFSAALVLASLLAASCATVKGGRPAGGFDALGAGAALYFRVDVASARPVLAALAKKIPYGNKASAALDRTDSAAVALYRAGGPRRYLVAAAGRYPASGSLSLTLSTDWKRRATETGARYWRSDEGISLAFSRDRAVVSDGEPFASASPPTPPAEYDAAGNGAALAGWVDEPAAAISGLLAGAGVPIKPPVEDLVFALIREKGTDRFVMEARLVAASAERARSLVVMLKLVRPALEGADGRQVPALFSALLAAAPALEGNVVVLRSAPLTADGIALLCEDVSIYFKQ
jgi:hypothetical protein